VSECETGGPLGPGERAAKARELSGNASESPSASYLRRNHFTIKNKLDFPSPPPLPVCAGGADRAAKESALSQLFDAYDASYRDVVQSSIDFSGLPHDFFMQAKADLLGRVLRRRTGVAHAGRLLDVGCGVGTLHPYMAGLFDGIAGVDISAPCVAEAAQRCPKNTYAVSAPGEPFPGGNYDVTLAVCTLHHVPPKDWAAFVANMARVTRPGGLVCIIEHNPLNPLTRLAVNRCPFDADAVLLRSGQSERLLRQAGAKKIETDFFLFLPTKMTLVRRLETWMGAIPFGAQYLTCAEV
jgi:SAM-dependent methyltransferase